MVLWLNPFGRHSYVLLLFQTSVLSVFGLGPNSLHFFCAWLRELQPFWSLSEVTLDIGQNTSSIFYFVKCLCGWEEAVTLQKVDAPFQESVDGSAQLSYPFKVQRFHSTWTGLSGFNLTMMTGIWVIKYLIGQKVTNSQSGWLHLNTAWDRYIYNDLEKQNRRPFTS